MADSVFACKCCNEWYEKYHEMVSCERRHIMSFIHTLAKFIESPPAFKKCDKCNGMGMYYRATPARMVAWGNLSLSPSDVLVPSGRVFCHPCGGSGKVKFDA